MAAKKKKVVAKTPRPRAPKRAAAAGAVEEQEGEASDQTLHPAPFSMPKEAPHQVGVDKDIRTRSKQFAAAMNKDGRTLVAMADEAPNVYELRRPTGIMPLDVDLGGGFPAGGLSIISGPDNAGKTWLMMRTIANHQRLYGDRSAVAYAGAEGSFDYKRAMQNGVVIPVPDRILSEWNQERLNLGMPGYTNEQVLWFKREVGIFHILRGHTGEELMHVVLEAVKANIYGIVGVDSLSVLLPEADEAKDVGDTPKRAGNANLMTDFIRKYTPYTSGLIETNPTTLLGIMQVRANAERANAQPHIQKYLKEWAVTGAYAIRHGKLIDLTVWDGEKLKRNIHGQSQVYGKVLHWRTEKGKAGTHDNISGEAEFRYDLPQGHDDLGSLITSGIARGVFMEQGGKVEIYHPVLRQRTDLGGFSDYNAFRRVLESDFDFELQMRYFVLAAFGVQCLYKPLD